jgi:hypothetical protein
MVSPRPADVRRLLETSGPGEGASELSGFHFDIELCRKAFDYYDSNQSGTLDQVELRKLVDVLWTTFNPNGPKLDENNRSLMVVSILSESSSGEEISFDEFVPWYHRMQQKFYAQEHEVGADASAAEVQASAMSEPSHAATQMHILCNSVLTELWRAEPSISAIEAAAQRVLETSIEIAKNVAELDPNQAQFAFLAADEAYHRAVASIMLAGPSKTREASGDLVVWGEQTGTKTRVSEPGLEVILKSYVHLMGKNTCSQLAQVESLLEGLVVAAERGSSKLKTCAVFILSQVALAGTDMSLPGTPQSLPQRAVKPDGRKAFFRNRRSGSSVADCKLARVGGGVRQSSFIVGGGVDIEHCVADQQPGGVGRRGSGGCTDKRRDLDAAAGELAGRRT